MTETITLSLEQIGEIARRALLACGAGSDAADTMAAAIRAAERDGIPTHGLAYLPTYCEHLKCGKVRGDATPRFLEEGPAAFVIDADCGFAHPAIALGFERLVPAASRLGLAAIAVRNSYNCGVLGFHVEYLASRGLVGLGFTNAPASIAPVGGTRAVIGTNPFALAVPDGNGGASIVIDQSSSVVAKSEIMARAREGRSIPEVWAFDAEGRPTSDAAAALKGTMAPAGGYKGIGIGLMVEVFAACLSGATLGLFASPFSGATGGPPRTGQFFLALEPNRFSGGAFAERCTDLIAAFAAQPGARLPGARRKLARLRAMAGMPVPSTLLRRIEAIAAPGDPTRRN